jgi:RNA polymerase sigma-70 factor, ECF subfamily
VDVTTKIEGFDRLVEPFRKELLAYCYRMLGSAHDAEDLVQDTYLRAWRAREQYDETRSSMRTWLYRIATNACLTALAVRSRRPLPSGLVAASDPLGPLVRGQDGAWLQPLPDSLLEAGDPASAVIDRSSLRLAFAAALQHLSPRQRGALILRDVLGFSASETAEILGTTAVSVNSSLQRARARVKEAGVMQEPVSEPSAAEQRAWVDRYVKAFEHADIEGLKRLVTKDVLMEMPPMLNWFTGPDNYGLFMEWVFGKAGTDWRLQAVAANGQPGFAAYRRTGDRYELHTLQIFTVTAEGISRNSVFQESEIFASFGLAAELDVHGRVALSGECLQAGGDFPVAVDGHQVDSGEGAAVAEPGDLLTGGLDGGHLVARDLVGERGGYLDIGDGGGEPTGHGGAGQDHDASVDGDVDGVGIAPPQLSVNRIADLAEDEVGGMLPPGQRL